MSTKNESPLGTQNPQNPISPTVCLAMIVKNEAHVIERCLNSVKDVFTEIIIHDTGSTDDTVNIVTKWIKQNGKHGYITSVPWVDFGKNRSDVLHAASYCSEYTFMLDADEELIGAIHVDVNEPCDTYQMTCKLGGVSYRRNFLFKSDAPWRYEGVVHEYPVCESEKFTTGHIAPNEAHILSHHDGARSRDSDKYKKDAELLENITNRTPREWFYLAQSLKDSGDIKRAYIAYRSRTILDGWFQEVAYSHYMMGKLSNEPSHYLNAYEVDPRRAEPLLALGKHYMDKKMWHVAHIYLLEASFMKAQDDMLFREDDVYDWRAKMELAVCSHYCGNYAFAAHINENIINQDTVPQHARAQAQTNLKYAQEALAKREHVT